MNTTVLILLACIAAYWFIKPRAQQTPYGQDRRRTKNRFPAASINHAEDSCQAVRALEGKRYLAWEAPNIPVPQCDAASCNCRYQCYEDRRESSRERRAPVSTADTALSPERRQAQNDRRRAQPEQARTAIYGGELIQSSTR